MKKKKGIIILIIAILLIIIGGVLIFVEKPKPLFDLELKKEVNDLGTRPEKKRDYLLTLNQEGMRVFKSDLDERKQKEFKKANILIDYNENYLYFRDNDGKRHLYHIPSSKFLDLTGVNINELTREGFLVNHVYGFEFFDKNVKKKYNTKKNVRPFLMSYNKFFLEEDDLLDENQKVVLKGYIPKEEIKEGMLLLNKKDSKQEDNLINYKFYNLKNNKVSKSFNNYVKNPKKEGEYYLLDKRGCTLLTEDFAEKKCQEDIKAIDDSYFQKMNPGIPRINSNEKYVFINNFQSKELEQVDTKTKKKVNKEKITSFLKLENHKNLDIYYYYSTKGQIHLINVTTDETVSFALGEKERALDFAKTKKFYIVYLLNDKNEPITRLYNMKKEKVKDIKGLVTPLKKDLEISRNVAFINDVKYIDRKGKLLSKEYLKTFKLNDQDYFYSKKEIGNYNYFFNKFKTIKGEYQGHDNFGIYYKDKDEYKFVDPKFKVRNFYKMKYTEEIPERNEFEKIFGLGGNLFLNDIKKETHKVINSKGKTVIDKKGLIVDAISLKENEIVLVVERFEKGNHYYSLEYLS